MSTSTCTAYISDIAPYKNIAGNTVTSGWNTRIVWDLLTGYSWLTPWFKYYTADNGWVSIDTTDTAWNTQEEVGVALSATEIIKS